MAVDERTPIENELFEAHFYGGDLDPALVWELEEGRAHAQHQGEVAPLDSLAAMPYGPLR